MRFAPVALFLLLLQDGDAARRVLPDEVRVEKVDLAVDVERARRALAADPPARIEAWRAEGKHFASPRGSSAWAATVVRIDTPAGAVDVAVSILEGEDMIARVRVSGAGAAKIPQEFLRRFGGLEIDGEALLEPRSTLEAARAKAEGKDADAAVLRALLSIRGSMCAFHPVHNAATERLRKRERKSDEAEALARLFDDMSKAAPDLSFLREESRKRLREYSVAASGQAKAIADGLRAGDFAKAEKAKEAVGDSCNACHGQFRRPLRSERARRKIGDGYFVVGYDVVAEPGADPKALQAVADGVRRASVLLSTAK